MAARPHQRTLRLALAQIDPVVGDIAGNAAMVRARIGEARDAGAQLVAFPELAITGYPPEDLLLKPHFLAAAEEALEALAAELDGIVVVVGFAERAAASASSTTRPPSSATAPCSAATGRCCCRTTGSSTSGVTSSRARPRRSSRSAASASA